MILLDAEQIRAAQSMPISEAIERCRIPLKAGRSGEYTGPCPRCGDSGHDPYSGLVNRFSVNVRKEVWNCRRCRTGGRGIIGLMQFIHGYGFREAVEDLVGRPGLQGFIPAPSRIHAPLRRPEEAPSPDKQVQKARWLWRQSLAIEGTVVERYLMSRGLAGPWPATLRYLPPTRPDHHQAMIAPYAITTEPEPGVLFVPVNSIVAVHLTLLKPDGSGKADVDSSKITVGSPRGRPIVVAPMNDGLGLAVAEGIEDALSAHQATGAGAWAAGCAAFMPALVRAVPRYADWVTVLVDADEAGRLHAPKLVDGLKRRGLFAQHFELGAADEAG